MRVNIMGEGERDAGLGFRGEYGEYGAEEYHRRALFWVRGG
jgi:hypothetical protein